MAVGSPRQREEVGSRNGKVLRRVASQPCERDATDFIITKKKREQRTCHWNPDTLIEVPTSTVESYVLHADGEGKGRNRAGRVR
jgi:hypothetical protein